MSEPSNSLLTQLINSVKQLFKRNNKNEVNLVAIGPLLFPNHASEFETYYQLYQTDKKQFALQYDEVLTNYDHQYREHLNQIEILYAFADAHQLCYATDWRGEENEGEIIAFLNQSLKVPCEWNHSIKSRIGIDEDEYRDGKFIIDLFNSIDLDLQTVNQRLLFFNLDADSYAYMPVQTVNFNEVINQFPKLFHSVEKLRK